MAVQTFVALAMVLFIVFPAMGKNYDAAVISSGYGGISMGGTPTAMVKMAAVSQSITQNSTPIAIGAKPKT